MVRHRKFVSLALVGFAASQSLVAQTVSGRLIDGLALVPVGRAFIVLLDAAGTELERVLTDAQGNFVLTAPGAGRYQLRSERIGFRA